jgi:hypothetical protein
MIYRITVRHRVTHLCRQLALVALLGLTLAQGPAISRADESDATPIVLETPPAATEPTETPTPDATVVPEPTATEIPPTGESEPSPQPSPTATDAAPDESLEAAETPAATVEPGALRYAPHAHPSCQPAPGLSEEVALGGSIDYSCELVVDLAGERIDPAAVYVDWRMAVTPGDGWQVQLLAPPEQNEATPRWSDHSGDPIELRGRTRLETEDAPDASGSFDTTWKVTVGLRLWRSGCGAGDVPARVAVETVAGVDDPATATVDQLMPQPDPFELRPELLPTPEPTLSFGGSLDFGEIPIDALGVQQPPAPQTLTITVGELDKSCGDWSLAMLAEMPDGENERIDTPSLHIVAIDDVAVPGDGCALQDGCNVAIVSTGATDATSVTFTLSISLQLPKGIPAAQFTSTLTATLTDAAASE